MAKFPTYPILYDEVLTIDISNLKKWGYLKIENQKKSSISWSRNGDEIASISVEVNMHSNLEYIKLNYTFKEKLIGYKISMVSVPSNLEIGKIWYFLCPITKKRCRKLYLVNGLFLHREAFKGMYKKQTEPKKWRKIRMILERHFALDDIYEEIYSKYFRSHYAGKPTRRYLRLIKKIEVLENINSFKFR